MRYLVAIIAVLTLVGCAQESEPEPDGSWVILDAPLPAEREIAVVEAEWRAGADPLYVENIDVMDPDRKSYIEDLKAKWNTDLIDECSRLLKLYEDGKVEEYEAGLKALNQKYLANTHFRVARIWRDENGKGRVEFEGSTGARLTLIFDPDN